MATRFVCNSEPDFCDREFAGTCPETGEEATVKIRFLGSKWVKTDHYKTYSPVSKQCSLWEYKIEKYCACSSCHLMQQKKL